MKNVLIACALLTALILAVLVSIQPCTVNTPRVTIGEVIVIGGCTK